MEEWVVSSVLVGSTFGAVVGGSLSDRFGRRKTMLWGGAIFCLGSTLAALAPSVTILVLARFTLGLAVGFTSVTAPVYISELAPSHSRGRLISLYQLALTFGIAFADLVGYLLAERHAWRWMFGVGLLPAMLFVLAVLPLPESPRWLLTRGRRAQAEAEIYPSGDPEALAAFKQIRSTPVPLAAPPAQGWRALLRPPARAALFVAAGFTILQQVTGVNTLIYYGPRIFSLAGISTSRGTVLATLLIAIVNVLCTLVAIAFVDRLGRKPLLYAGVSGMGVCLFALAFCFQHQQALGPSLGGLAIACLLGYMACFALSMGPIAWILVAEVFPAPLRSRGAALATLGSGLANTLVSATFLSFIHAAGIAAVFSTYGVLCIVTLLFTKFVIPETRGRELEQISSSENALPGFEDHTATSTLHNGPYAL